MSAGHGPSAVSCLLLSSVQEKLEFSDSMLFDAAEFSWGCLTFCVTMCLCSICRALVQIWFHLNISFINIPLSLDKSVYSLCPGQHTSLRDKKKISGGYSQGTPLGPNTCCNIESENWRDKIHLQSLLKQIHKQTIRIIRQEQIWWTQAQSPIIQNKQSMEKSTKTQIQKTEQRSMINDNSKENGLIHSRN